MLRPWRHAVNMLRPCGAMQPGQAADAEMPAMLGQQPGQAAESEAMRGHAPCNQAMLFELEALGAIHVLTVNIQELVQKPFAINGV